MEEGTYYIDQLIFLAKEELRWRELKNSIAKLLLVSLFLLASILFTGAMFHILNNLYYLIPTCILAAANLFIIIIVIIVCYKWKAAKITLDEFRIKHNFGRD